MLFRASTLRERKKFYSEEFNLKKAMSFFNKKPKYFAVDFGTETKIIKDKKMDNKLLYFGAKDLKKRLITYLPEDVYYDRNLHKGKFCLFCLKTKNYFQCKNFLGQELVFDVDADNIKCTCKRLCEKCIKKSINNAFEIAGKLKFNKIKVVYSGKGCHVHVFDKKAYKLDIKERKKLAKRFSSYGIDRWVTEGRIRLVRLPYSLNGVVSRIATPIGKKEKFEFKNTLPKFLK
jgi:DNA primase catalytic subunit